MVLVAFAIIQVAFLAVSDRVDRVRRESRLSVTVEPRSEVATDLMVEKPDGSKLRVVARSGRFQLIHFWATWCPPCRGELPTLFEMAEKNRRRLSVLAISTDPDWRAVHQFLGGRMTALVMRDPSGVVAKAFGVTNLPDTYLIGPDGRIRARFSGAQLWTSEKMDKMLDQLILGS